MTIKTWIVSSTELTILRWL